MAEQDTKKVVEGAYDAFGRRDIPDLLGRLTDDVEWSTPGEAVGIPYAGPKRGRDEVAGFFQALAGAEEITDFRPREFIAQGDKVVVLGNYKGHVISTRREYDIDWIQVFTVRDGKISGFREFLDTAALAECYRAAAGQAA
jgi:ketosteroid isomerase-like protein